METQAAKMTQETFAPQKPVTEMTLKELKEYLTQLDGNTIVEVNLHER